MYIRIMPIGHPCKITNIASLNGKLCVDLERQVEGKPDQRRFPVNYLVFCENRGFIKAIDMRPGDVLICYKSPSIATQKSE